MEAEGSIQRISELGDNAFPKISGKRVEFLERLMELAQANKLPPILDIEGTVKLHGMHADIVFDIKTLAATEAVHALSNDRPSSLNVSFQSRNKLCDPDASTNGWPRSIAKQPDALVYLRERILARYHEKNPDLPLDYNCPLIIAGEWIGHRVQRDVGVSSLSHRFVILTIQLNGQWQRDSDYDDIEATKADIYSIFRAGRQVLKFDTSNFTDSNPVLLEMQSIADRVEACCPFAAHFGVENSQGEGVVWKPGCPEGRADAKYWIKTKGPISGPENRIDAQSIIADQARKTSLDEMCARFVTPRRVEQGFEYLVEMGIEPSRQSMKMFINWVLNDVQVEEKGEIEAMGKVWKGVEGMVNKKVKWLARCAFIEQMEKCGVSIA